MLPRFFGKPINPTIESLGLAPLHKELAYYLMARGNKGANTFDLHKEQFVNLSKMIRDLQDAGFLIKTVKKTIKDKRGYTRKRIAHRYFIGFCPFITAALI